VRILAAYWVEWLLFFVFLACGTTAALYFQFLPHEKFIIAALLQVAGVFLALTLAYFFFERKAQIRQRRINETIESSIASMKTLATSAVITVTGQWWDKPDGHDSYGPTNGPKVYSEARELVLYRSHQLGDYRSNVHSLGSLEWVFRQFEHVALDCRQMILTAQLGLIELRALRSAMLNLEERVASEKQLWEEFQISADSRRAPIPSEAVYNLFSIAELTVRVIDVLDSKDYSGNPEYEGRRRFAPETFYRSKDWGLRRR